jgi:predicted RNase H-like nuclease (RuvC/YqgF family)
MDKESLSALAKVSGRAIREGVVVPLTRRQDASDARITALSVEIDRLKQRNSALDRHIMALEKKFGELHKKVYG